MTLSQFAISEDGPPGDHAPFIVLSASKVQADHRPLSSSQIN